MITFSQNCLHLREQCMKDKWKAKSHAYVFGIGRIMYAVYGILLDTFLNHCISRGVAWINWKEHSRALPRQLEAQSMVYNEKLKEQAGQCLTQSGSVLMLALLPFKVRPDNFQRSLPTYILLWLGCIFMGMWTILFHLVHLGIIHSLSPSLSQARMVLWGRSQFLHQEKKRSLKPTKKIHCKYGVLAIRQVFCLMTENFFCQVV